VPSRRSEARAERNSGGAQRDRRFGLLRWPLPGSPWTRRSTCRTLVGRWVANLESMSLTQWVDLVGDSICVPFRAERRRELGDCVRVRPWGNVPPVATIAGAATLLATPGSAEWRCGADANPARFPFWGPAWIRVSPDGKLFVDGVSGNAAPTGGGQPYVAVFAAGASGNAVPLSRIAGPRTDLVKNDDNGIAVDFASGLIYVADFVKNPILVFGVSDSGNVAPRAILVGNATGLRVPAFISPLRSRIVGRLCAGQGRGSGALSSPPSHFPAVALRRSPPGAASTRTSRVPEVDATRSEATATRRVPGGAEAIMGGSDR
jgi:hypothetical protein